MSFDVGSRVIVRRGARRGAVAVVAACDDAANTVTVDAPEEDAEPQFGLGIASALGDKFASGKLAASELGLTEAVLETYESHPACSVVIAAERILFRQVFRWVHCWWRAALRVCLEI